MEQKKLIDLESNLDIQEEELQEKRLEANYDVESQIRRWLSKAIKESPLSRYEIAAKMSELLDREISKHQLDSWTAESKEGYHLPASYMPALAAVLDNFTILKILSMPLGIQVIEPKDLIWLEYGKLRQVEKKLRLRKKQLENKLQRE